jgi:hypothetical protein
LDAGFRDGTISYEELTNLSIEMRDLGKRGGGLKGSCYCRGVYYVLRNKDGVPVNTKSIIK